jgi:alpha-tubulin suppressor-like RCC1 family protein
MVITGEDHSMALTKDFKVYGWGQAEHGAIGMRLSNAKVPNLINVFNERAQ